MPAAGAQPVLLVRRGAPAPAPARQGVEERLGIQVRRCGRRPAASRATGQVSTWARTSPGDGHAGYSRSHPRPAHALRDPGRRAGLAPQRQRAHDQGARRPPGILIRRGCAAFERPGRCASSSRTSRAPSRSARNRGGIKFLSLLASIPSASRRSSSSSEPAARIITRFARGDGAGATEAAAPNRGGWRATPPRLRARFSARPRAAAAHRCRSPARASATARRVSRRWHRPAGRERGPRPHRFQHAHPVI